MAVDSNLAVIAGFENLYLSKNRIEINIDPASPLITDRSGLRYFLQLFVAPFHNAAEADFVALPEMEAIEEPIETIGSVQLAKGAYFEVSKILHSILSASAPDFGLNKIKLNPNLVRTFKYTARVENNGVEITTDTSTLKRVYRGGINEKQTDGWLNTVFDNYFKAGNEYLTFSAASKVLPYQPLFLSVLINQIPSPTTIKLRVFAKYTNGDEDETPSTISLTASQAFSVYTIPVGPQFLGLLGRPLKVKSYTVWLTNQADEVVTSPKEFTIDWENYSETRFIIFRNSLSCPETLACVGKSQESINIGREVFTINREYGAPATFSEKIINQVTAERQLVLNTGWLTDAERTWLEELALSEEILLVTDRGHVPLILNDSAYLSNDTDETLIGRTFSFSYINPEHSFSSLPVAEVAPVSGTAWRAYNMGTCELDEFGKRTGKQLITHLELYYTATNLAVKPAQTKVNSPDTEGYLPPQTSATCATPNHLNQALSQQSTYRKQGCSNGFQGTYVTLSIAANLYGSEISVADANAKAEAVMLLNDTQAYADANGTCSIAPWSYTMSVPANRINIRWVLNTFYSSIMLAGGPGAYSGLGSEESSGNHWMVGSSTNPNSLKYTPANNQDMLVNAYSSTPGYFIDTTKPGTYTVYQNGTQFYQAVVSQAQITAGGGVFRVKITASNTWVNQDKIYIDIVV